MADNQHHPDIAPLARRVSTLVATLRQLTTFVDRDLPASIGHELQAAELAVAQLIDDMHERMVSRWTVKELPQATPVPSGLHVTRYDANGQRIGAGRVSRFAAAPPAGLRPRVVRAGALAQR